ncbi:MAG: hypothetical protein QOH06_5941 [Acidobacteriota bacterium]|jgi:hypothetical protein|nr:hypothetical protein [Acidobacteriota bacterium]
MALKEDRYQYPAFLKLKIAGSLLLELWFFGTGIYYVATYPPSSLNAQLGLAVALLIFAVAAVNLTKLLNILRTEISLLETGIHLRRGDRELIWIAWPEVGEVRAKGRWGDFEISSKDSTKMIRVHRRLIGLGDLRRALSMRLTAAGSLPGSLVA